MDFGDTLESLREAVQNAPKNIPLRVQLANRLFEEGHLEEAEKAYREALLLAPDHAALKLGLAKTFFAQGKLSAAIVLVEDLVNGPAAPADARRRPP